MAKLLKLYNKKMTMVKVIKVNGKMENNMVKDYAEVDKEKKDMGNGNQVKIFNGLQISDLNLLRR